ncbi:hypothetical protein LCGC14_1957090 [marine sediment metagenome]|uniref:Uncharacterized protein n=1 Tax=marine sediment metagenome TaxID=412755 RepID=A0A0F9HU24_9ZZZZ
MKRKWKLGCGATLEVVEIPGDSDEEIFVIRIVDRPSRGWFAQVGRQSGYPEFLTGSDVKLVILPEAIPKLIKILQYLEKQSAT